MQISIVPTLQWCHYARGKQKQILNRKISLFFFFISAWLNTYIFAKIHPVGEVCAF